MQKPLVKICGIIRGQDALLALDAGADAVGVNFLRGPRKIDYRVVRQWTLPAGALVVGLAPYPAANDAEFAQMVGHTGIHTFQLYSDAYPIVAAHGTCRVWLAAGVEDRASIRQVAAVLRGLRWQPAAVLLDSRVPGQLGGTGRSFDWNLLAEARAAGELNGLPPIVLAGGLTPENVAEAVRIVQPWAVDVSSGVEVAGRPGVKDPLKVRDFIAAAKTI